MPLDPATIASLRAALRPRRERYDLATIMNRWASEVIEACDQGNEPVLSPDNSTDWDALVAEILEQDPDAPKPKRRIKKRDARTGRPRSDKERYASLLLGMIYQEYTGKPPKRIVKANGAEPPFFRFAAAAFQAIGLYPRVQAFREVGERWDRSRDFRKTAMELLLFGNLKRPPAKRG